MGNYTNNPGNTTENIGNKIMGDGGQNASKLQEGPEMAHHISKTIDFFKK